MSKLLPIANGSFALVDDDDFERANEVTWHLYKRYVVRRIRLPDGRSDTQLLHRFILNAPQGMAVDHRDGDALNNQKSNLRLATKAQNGWNRGKNKNNKSGFKGVSWSKERSKWVAQIVVHGKNFNLGRYDDIEEAAAAYANAALEYHGEFART